MDRRPERLRAASQCRSRAGGLGSVMNAVVDALSEFGIRHIDMPATPETVWQAIRTAKGKAG